LKNIFILIGIAVFINFLSGCESCDCPTVTEGTLRLNLTINGENPRVPIQVFRGNIENGDLMVIDTVSESSVTFIFPAPGTYSATATYKKGNATVLAINGGKLTVTTDECECDQGETLRLNLRLAR
jgi:hypothetical protein